VDEPLLELTGVVAGYGAGDVLRGLDLAVPAGSVTCLIGPNGAGKSTVLRVVSGLLHPSAGAVRFRGRDLGRATPRQRLAAGIAHVPQESSLFPAMSVWENLLMGAYLLRDRALVRERAERAAEMFPLVTRRRAEHAGALSGGERRQVELARALMTDPALVLLDEPSIGLAPKARAAVFAAIAALPADGRTVVLVEQNARSGLAVADLGVVVQAGRVRLTGTGDELLADPRVGRLFLGAGATREGEREQGV
jgi:branched-chain amino acid transport system ATP-binding protein